MRKAFYTGLDLGQSQDYSALVVLEQTTWPNKPERDYAVRWIHRWPLQTSYVDVVAQLKEMFTTELQNSVLVIDGTGVGRPVVDMVRAAKLTSRVHAYSITCGLQPGEGTVPKKDLVGAVSAALQQRRIKLANLDLAATLEAEMEAFRVKVTADRNETFASWREKDHDDILLAFTLALWFAELNPNIDPATAYGYTEPKKAPHGVFNEGPLPRGVFG